MLATEGDDGKREKHAPLFSFLFFQWITHPTVGFCAIRQNEQNDGMIGNESVNCPKGKEEPEEW